MLEITVSFLLMALFTGAFMYLILCIDPNDPGILGKLHRLIYKYVPDMINKICGGEDSRFSKGVAKVFNYLCYTNHPIVQFFYILVAPGGFLLYWWVGFSVHFDDNPKVSYIHKYIALAFSYVAFYTYYCACKYGPGEITKLNVKDITKQFDLHYDDILYSRKNECKTCKFDKPARSKHCSTCKMCVSKFDHHCIWIRQCVGEKNYKYFLSFLIVHSAYCLYGLYIGIYCLYGIVLKSGLINAKFRGPSGEILDASWMIIFKYMFFRETMFIFIVILCGVMGITLMLFALYHLQLARKGFTTNEKIKRSDCMSYIKSKLKQLMEDAKNEQSEDKKADIHKKILELTTDYEKLEKWHVQKSFFQNLKDIYTA